MTKSDRIRELLKQGGISDAEIARRTNAHPAMVRKVRRARPRGRDVPLSAKGLKVISETSKKRWEAYRRGQV